MSVAIGSGMDVSKWSAMTRSMLSKMPGGRCPYPPGTEPGPGPGFNKLVHEQKKGFFFIYKLIVPPVRVIFPLTATVMHSFA